MKICVLQPDYSTTSVDYKDYDPARDLTELWPQAHIDHVLLNKLTTYKQLKQLKQKGYDCFVNLCEGYLEWEVPSVDVIYSLDLLNLPYTGPNLTLYDPSKELMKYVAHTEGIKTPPYVIINDIKNIISKCSHLKYPLFVKPSKAGDSLGIDEHSLIHDENELVNKVVSLLPEYDELMVEEYIKGREFTVLVAAGVADRDDCRSFKPVEFLFPRGIEFKTYAFKTSELHPECNVACEDPKIETELRRSAEKIFKAFNGVGYGRMDFRLDEHGNLFFLEVNFTCSVFYKEGMEGSADYVLLNDPIGKTGFLKHIVREGIARHRRKQRVYELKGNAINGFGIRAKQNVAEGATIFKGEELSQRIVSKQYVEKHWNKNERRLFSEYAYPLGNDIYILWSEEPSEWAPMNHSCDPNCCYHGLNVVTMRDIMTGEELTLDYSTFLNGEAKPFDCHCGAGNCRGVINLNTRAPRKKAATFKTRVINQP